MAPAASTAVDTATIAALASMAPSVVSTRTLRPSETAVTRVPSRTGSPAARPATKAP